MHFSKSFLKFINLMMEFQKVRTECKLKQLFNRVCTKPNLYSSGIKLMKLVYIPLNYPFLKTLVTNLWFSQNIFTSKKESNLFISVSIEHFMFLCFIYIFFIYIFKKKSPMFWLIKQNKNIIQIFFVINRFKIFQVIF